MASEQKRMKVVQGSGEYYVDLAAMLTAANRKQYHQVARDGTPMCYHVTVTSLRGNAVDISHAPNTWTTRNAVKMTVAGWKAQLKNADVKLRDLPRYGKNARLALEAAATTSETRNTVVQQVLDGHMQPVDASGSNLFTSYTDTAGTTIDYKFANPITQVPVANHTTGAVVDYPLILCTDVGSSDFNVIEEYLGARRNPTDLETDAPGPIATNKMTTLFSTAEELSDDIIDAVDDFGDNRPYSENGWKLIHAGTISQSLTTVSTNTGSPVTGSDSIVPQYPGVSCTFEAPLGLFKMGGAENNQYLIEVHSIYEM